MTDNKTIMSTNIFLRG